MSTKIPECLTPAYGRTYTSQRAIRADWEAGKDFLVNDFSSPWDGKPANRQSFVDDGVPCGTTIIVRYGQQLEKIASVKV